MEALDKNYSNIVVKLDPNALNIGIMYTKEHGATQLGTSGRWIVLVTH